MREVLSDTLQNSEPVLLGVEEGILDLYDGLTTPYSRDTVVLSKQHTQQIEAFVELAATHYASEPTLAQEKFGLPSLIVRVDCTIDQARNIIPYEMEDSPSGQGITDVLHVASGAQGIRQSVRGHFEDMLSELPTVIVSNARSHGTDDALIVGEKRCISIGHDLAATKIKTPVIVKAIPGNKESRQPYMDLQQQAVAPLVTEGDKSYGEQIGLLTSIDSEKDLLVDDYGNLRSQVVKARLGSMALGVSIYLSSDDRRQFGRAGTVSASRLQRDLSAYCEQPGGAFLQEFIPPIQIENGEDRTNAILRIFALLNRQDGRVTAKAIGGCYVARNETLVHGASNAICGAVLVE